MRLSIRFFLAYFILLGFAIFIEVRTFSDELVPGIRKAMEDMLVDTANVLAEMAAPEVAKGAIASGSFARRMTAFHERRFDAVIWFARKRDPNLMVYITDVNGIVVYDSRGRDVGKDYSRWNDVYLTLRGKYGARSTREDPGDEFSSVMYVAAPVRVDGRTVGVLTVGKPSAAVQPFVEAALSNIRERGVWLLLATLLVGAGITHWLTLSIRRLTEYAQAVREGRRVAVPQISEKELKHLAGAMDEMRTALEGKEYVEHYLHTLTHELKSPLAAIQGAAELLQEDMPREQQARFVTNIQNESRRLREVVERLLGLAVLEKRNSLEKVETVEITSLVARLVEDRAPVARARGLTLRFDPAPAVTAQGERFLLQQAISNLLDNAIEFGPPGSRVDVGLVLEEASWCLSVRDHGPGIPEYARGRLFERFYSLPRPDTGRKGTGLGLSLVREVAGLHGGSIVVENHPEGGAVAALRIPRRPGG